MACYKTFGERHRKLPCSLASPKSSSDHRTNADHGADAFIKEIRTDGIDRILNNTRLALAHKLGSAGRHGSFGRARLERRHQSIHLHCCAVESGRYVLG